MKYLCVMLAMAASLSANLSQASQYIVYGWDISCKGLQGVSVQASQSDDDFYITYGGGNLSKGRVWADSTVNEDSRSETLVFMTLQGGSPGVEASLVLVRNSTTDADEATGGSTARGVLILDRQRTPLNCYVRFAKGEDDFERVSKTAFPEIKEPTQ